MKRQGFTLIELLAVIVILVIIAFISTPIILNVIDGSQRRADLNSAYGLLDAGRLYYSESFLDDKKKENIKNYSNLWTDIVVQGEKPKEGYLYVNLKGNVALSVIYRNVCYQKHFQTELEILKKEDCGITFDPNDQTPPDISFQVLGNALNAFDWARKDFYVQMIVKDEESGVAYFDWCQTTDIYCIPTTHEKSETGTALITNESDSNKICVIARDQMGNQNDLVCSNNYRLDKTAPVIDGVDDITIPLKEFFDFEKNVVAFDKLSGVEGEIVYAPNMIDQSISKTTEILYTVFDKAGNVTIKNRYVTTVAEAPSVQFQVLNEPFNEHGWSSHDFLVEINGIDYSGHGIKEINWCVTTSDQCDPSLGNGSTNPMNYVEITVESKTNRICTNITDQTGNKSDIICSEEYQLDKTKPNFSGISDMTIRKDTEVDLRKDVVTSDVLSGITRTFEVIPETVDTSKSGITEILYTVEDYAGNKQEYLRKIIVTAEAPTVTFETESGKINGFGWAKENFLVTIHPIDQSGHGIKEYKWCSTINSDCDPSGNIAQTTQTGAVTISSESSSNRICVIVTDNSGKTSTNICSDIYKLDKTAPILNGVGNQNVTLGGTFNLENGVSIIENGSGLNGTYQYNPTSVDTSTMKDVTITYQVSDLAGNTTRVNRIISVIGYTWQKYNAVGTTNYYWNQYNVVTEEKGQAVYKGNELLSRSTYCNYYSNYKVIYANGYWRFDSDSSSYGGDGPTAREKNFPATHPYIILGSNLGNMYQFVSWGTASDVYTSKYQAGAVKTTSKGTYVTQVNSNSSTAYPNDGIAGSYWYVYSRTSTTYAKGSTSYGTVTSSSNTAYPSNGRHTDGYWYVKV